MQNCYNYRQNAETVTSSGKVNEVSLKKLSSEGYQLVINLLPDNSKHAVENEKELVESQGVIYVHIPVDFDAPTEANYHVFCQALRTHKGKKIHIHCAANYRASAFYAAYNVQTNTWTEQQAKQFLAEIWSPYEYDVWCDFLARHHIRCM